MKGWVREHAGQPIGPAASMFVIVLAQSEASRKLPPSSRATIVLMSSSTTIRQRGVDRPYYRDRERLAVRDHDQVADTTDKHPDREREQRDDDRHERNALA
jgi:hypothetical protein